jgi:surface antigen
MAADPFPWGQCTYWVASQRYVPWSGNAINWWGAAQSFAVPEGQVPVVGAIAVFDNGYYGHVALVTNVLADGSWQQSEMNVYGLGVVDTRTINPDEGDLVGFIY